MDMTLDIIKTPLRTYVISKSKRKEWAVRWYDSKTSDHKITTEGGFMLGSFPSKIVALGAVSMDVDTYTRMAN